MGLIYFSSVVIKIFGTSTKPLWKNGVRTIRDALLKIAVCFTTNSKKGESIVRESLAAFNASILTRLHPKCQYEGMHASQMIDFDALFIKNDVSPHIYINLRFHKVAFSPKNHEEIGPK